jgi:ABC-type branched-subunit amino acid transport system substrate-binding protein
VLGLVGTGSAGAQGSVRGFDGSTITVAGYGIKSQLPTGETGAAARFKRFNDTNEIKGVKINFTEFAEDGQDPATTLSIERRLVAQTKVFAIVPNMSTTNDVGYLAQQHVVSFGGGFDASGCSTAPSTKLWVYSPNGCVVPSTPSFYSDFFKNEYDMLSKKTGKKRPTWAIIINDNATGKNGARIFSKAAQGAGLDVVASLATVPIEVTDYTPYVQKLLSAAGGKAPDAIQCAMQVQCLSMFQLLTASGYKGIVYTSLYTDILVKPLKGAYTHVNFANLAIETPALKQLHTDLDNYQPGAAAKTDIGTVYAYGSADMFIQALKTVAKKGKSNLTPENVRKAASTMKWALTGLIGPVQYPKASVMTFPACYSDSYSDGSAWTQVVPLTCSTKTFPAKG